MLSHIQLFCYSMDCSPPGFSVHGISQARILEWVAISFSRGTSQARNRTYISCIGRQTLPLHHQGSPNIFKKKKKTSLHQEPSSEKKRGGRVLAWKALDTSSAEGEISRFSQYKLVAFTELFYFSISVDSSQIINILRFSFLNAQLGCFL